MTKIMLLVLLLAAGASGQSAGDVQKMLAAEAAKARALGTDAILIEAVRAQNAKKVPLETIRKMDEQWVSGKAPALVKQTTTGPCADRLRVLAAGGAYREAFVMDERGAIVCATAKTSDYWQGDEAKFEQAYNGGKGNVFIDRPKYDDSTSASIAQISVPVIDNGKAIGAVTVGLSMAR